jgi:NAD-dependent deacetylase
MHEQILYVADLIAKSKRIVISTGAGGSKESGVPTFRDAMDGLWARFDPQQLATPEAFLANPKLVWDWYEYRRGLVRRARPNPGHIALAHLEARHKFDWLLITQNVDDLHEQAGSQNIVHLHGNIAANKCFADCQGKPTPIDVSTLEWDKDNGPPKCPHCGEWVRPDVVWFGEALPEEAIQTAYDRSGEADLMIVVGTSGLVQPAANLPRWAKYAKAKVIEVNPAKTPITQLADVYLPAPSGEVLPEIVAVLLH